MLQSPILRDFPGFSLPNSALTAQTVSVGARGHAVILTSAPVPGSPTPRELAWEFMGSFFGEETKNTA